MKIVQNPSCPAKPAFTKRKPEGADAASTVQQQIAESRLEIEQARLLCHRACQVPHRYSLAYMLSRRGSFGSGS